MCSVSVEKLIVYFATAVEYSLHGTPTYSTQHVATLVITAVNTFCKRDSTETSIKRCYK